MVKQADLQPQQLDTAATQHKRQRSVGTGSPIATISSKFEPSQQQQQSTTKRPGYIPRASSTSSKRLSASAASIPAEAPANPSRAQTSTPPPPPSEDNSVAPGALRRSLSFKLPIRVSTDNNNFPPSNANRSRASSLPQESEPPVDKRRHSTQRSLASLTSIIENNTVPKDLAVPQATSPKPSPKSPSKQFLLERGLLNPDELDVSNSPEELQVSLQDQVVKFLTTMSSPTSQKSDTAEQQRAPAYPTSYPPNNGQLRPNMSQPGLPVPMPNLSGNANGPIGNLLKGPVDDKGQLTKAALMVGIKLDLEAEVHITARVRGDILVGLY
ncbi:uncharacterized protein CTRU02_211457 [Colletotrichum truncatum]|uniref:Uncharacterized protein n=1 Tax=Colletotrichum truncatum TaxID=5467 RepID=A0ACC3YRS7_COLTU|nr:uncharacterized protein CTRU02_02237 [Colletotrichum truncatum]KAF6799366.1 hypothetical protein CTRU02_02237 [Colletotrichum truncatum]